MNNARQEIIKQSELLFRKNGYQNTSVRQIADACGIAVGNLCFYFPKKEDLLMEHHNLLMASFLANLPDNLKTENSWDTYFAVEYCFMHEIILIDTLRRLYQDVINIPSLRKQYIDMHHQLFLQFLPDCTALHSPEQLYYSTVCMASVEFHLAELFDERHGTVSFDELMNYVFEVRLDTLDFPVSKRKRMIQSGKKRGKELLDEIPDLRSRYDPA